MFGLTPVLCLSMLVLADIRSIITDEVVYSIYQSESFEVAVLLLGELVVTIG